jgi:hypothetical protein
MSSNGAPIQDISDTVGPQVNSGHGNRLLPRYRSVIRRGGSIMNTVFGAEDDADEYDCRLGGGNGAETRLLVVGGIMTSVWLSANSTLVTALAGLASTVFVAIYMTRSNAHNAEAERLHNARQLMLTERKSAYERMLQAFEEFDDTVYMLRGNGFRKRSGVRFRSTKQVRALLERNSKVDLAIQDLERELELIAPLEVVKACRVTFRALREKTQVFLHEGAVGSQPYNAYLAKTVILMRLDLDKIMRSDGDREIGSPLDCSEQEFMSLYDEWLAPENMFSRQG